MQPLPFKIRVSCFYILKSFKRFSKFVRSKREFTNYANLIEVCKLINLVNLMVRFLYYLWISNQCRGKRKYRLEMKINVELTDGKDWKGVKRSFRGWTRILQRSSGGRAITAAMETN